MVGRDLVDGVDLSAAGVLPERTVQHQGVVKPLRAHDDLRRVFKRLPLGAERLEGVSDPIQLSTGPTTRSKHDEEARSLNSANCTPFYKLA